MKIISITRILLLAAAGACAGFATFALLDPSLREQEIASRSGSMTDLQEGLGQAFTHAVMLGCVLGAAVGGALIFAEEITTGRWGRTIGRVLLGALAGAVFGGAGGIGGQILLSILLAPMAVLGQAAMPFVVVARTAGWSLVGAAAGICPGVVSGSRRRIRQGWIGGALGGAGGGLLFDAIASAMQADNGSVSRCVGFTLIGLAVGALVGLIEEAGKQFWLTMLTGSREGRVFILAKPATTLGRNEMADVPLFGDPNVQQAHAAILLNGSEASLHANTPILVNGHVAAAGRLADGDILTIGRHHIRFNARRSTKSLPVAPLEGRLLPPEVAPLVPGSAGFPPQSQPPATGGGFPPHLQPPVMGGGSPPHLQPPVTPPGVPPRWLPPAAGAGAPQPPLPTIPGEAGAPTLSFVPPATTAVVTVAAGPHSGETFPLFHGAIAGRDPRCDIVLIHDTQASRQHARFLLESDSLGTAWRIEDGGSSNGTYVNGQRIASCLLQPGDQITLGKSVLRIG